MNEKAQVLLLPPCSYLLVLNCLLAPATAGRLVREGDERPHR